MPKSIIPSFFLYGDPPRAVGDRFLHVERLDDRSRPSDWTISPHSHPNLSHIFFIESGMGSMHADGVVLSFHAPCLLVVPAGVVHGFSFRPDTTGSVLTLARPYEDELFRREVDLAAVMSRVTCLGLAKDHRLDALFLGLAREFIWSAPGHRAAVDAMLLGIFVDVLRLLHHADAISAPLGPQALLVARFRALIEDRFRRPVAIKTYAVDLRVGVSRLRDACLTIAGKNPTRLVQDRLVVEAKRILLYSDMSVAEAGFYLGYEDAAYFSRVFSKAVGESPRSFRSRHCGGATERVTLSPRGSRSIHQI